MQRFFLSPSWLHLYPYPNFFKLSIFFLISEELLQQQKSYKSNTMNTRIPFTKGEVLSFPILIQLSHSFSVPVPSAQLDADIVDLHFQILNHASSKNKDVLLSAPSLKYCIKVKYKYQEKYKIISDTLHIKNVLLQVERKLAATRWQCAIDIQQNVP